ncbi:hypothetical protein SLE2022_077620 [Rubroshorea leprosula]
MLGYDNNVHRGYPIDTQHDTVELYYGQYRGYDDTEYNQTENDDTVYNQTENDEVIARTLQEEFSQLAIAEASDLSNSGEEQVQTFSDAPDWHNSSAVNYYSAHASYDYGQNEHGSCSSPSDSEEYSYSLEPTDGYLIDDEVGQRLSQMVQIPYVPRINREIPSFDEATSDHERLLNRLQLYNFVENKVQGDGNCQFRALSDQLYRTPEHHEYVRRQVVNQLKSQREKYEGYVPMDYDDYLKKMSKSGEWGDHVTLQATADTYGSKILVITSFKDTCYIEIVPDFQKSKGVIFLSFWAEVHYNSIYFQGEVPEVPKKKKWWSWSL